MSIISRMGGFLAILVAFCVFTAGIAEAGQRRYVKEDDRPAVWKKAKGKDILTAEQVARSDAMRKLMERIYGMEIDGDISVYDLVKIDKRMEVNLRGNLRGMREKRWHYYEDGSCQIEMVVTWREIVKRIEKDIKDKKVNGEVVERERFIKRNIENRDKDIVVWGSGALAGTAGVEIIQAQRAAEVDAYEKLATRIMGIKIDSRTTIRDMALVSDEIQTALAASLKGVEFTDYAIKEKWVEAVGKLTIESIVKRIERTYKKTVEKKRWRRNKITENSFEKVTTRKDIDVFEETGKGARVSSTTITSDSKDDPFATERTVIEKVVKQKIVVK